MIVMRLMMKTAAMTTMIAGPRTEMSGTRLFILIGKTAQIKTNKWEFLPKICHIDIYYELPIN